MENPKNEIIIIQVISNKPSGQISLVEWKFILGMIELKCHGHALKFFLKMVQSAIIKPAI
jgi:hypothetical protein